MLIIEERCIIKSADLAEFHLLELEFVYIRIAFRYIKRECKQTRVPAHETRPSHCKVFRYYHPWGRKKIF